MVEKKSSPYFSMKVMGSQCCDVFLYIAHITSPNELVMTRATVLSGLASFLELDGGKLKRAMIS